MPLTAELYWLPHCSTCQKAKTFLEEKGIRFTLVRDMKAEPLSEAEVQRLVQAVGNEDLLFSKRAMRFRQWGLHDKTLAPNDLLDLMVKEYTFIKRPVVIFSNGYATAGFAPKQLEKTIASL